MVPNPDGSAPGRLRKMEGAPAVCGAKKSGDAPGGRSPRRVKRRAGRPGYPSFRIRSSASLTLDIDHRMWSASSGPMVPSHLSRSTRAASVMPLSSR